MLPSARARRDFPLPPQPIIAIRSTGHDPSGQQQAGVRTRGTGIGQPPENLFEGAELAGQPENAEPVQAGGDEFGVPGSSGDVQQPGDAVGSLLSGGSMQCRGREDGSGRDRGRRDGKASGEHGLEQALGHLPCSGVPVREQQHRRER